MGERDMGKFKRVPVAEITSPEKPGPLWPMKDYWWAVTADDCVLIYTHRGANSPQCNQNRAITERLMTGDGITVKQLPWAYVPFSLSEYE